MSPRGAVTGNATEKQGTYEDDERLSEMIAKDQREKIELCERIKERPQGEIEESLKELRRRQSEEENELLKKMDSLQHDNLLRGKEDFCAKTKDDECAKKLEEVPEMMASRAQMVGDLRKRMEENEEEQESIMKMVLRGIANVSPAAGKLVALILQRSLILKQSPMVSLVLLMLCRKLTALSCVEEFRNDMKRVSHFYRKMFLIIILITT